MKFKSNLGISLVTVVITIVVIIILASVSTTYSLRMINDSADAKKEATIYEDREIIRTLLTETIGDENKKVGFALLNGSLVVLDSGDNEYGTGYYLIPGGEDDGDLGTIKFKLGDDTLTAYKGLSAPYVVDYYTGDYERVEEIRFKE